MPVRSPARRGLVFRTKMQRIQSQNHDAQLCQEDRDLLANACQRRLVPGISKSQEFSLDKKRGQVLTLSRSAGNSPVRRFAARQKSDHQKTNIMDVMDGLDNTI